MATSAQTTKTIQKYTVYIKATPQAIWDALTKAEWTEKYGYGPLVDYDLRPGGKFRAYPNEGMKAFGMPDGVAQALGATSERFDGKGPRRWRGADLPTAARIVDVADALELFAWTGGPQLARTVPGVGGALP